VNALSVRCGVCGAEPNEPCVTPSGKLLPKGAHAVRIWAAKQASR